MKSQILSGVAISNGFCSARVLRINELNLNFKTSSNTTPEVESKRLKNALTKAINELEALKEKALKHLNETDIKIFDSHILMLKDPMLFKDVMSEINLNLCAEGAILKVREKYLNHFKSLTNNLYISERSNDIYDATNRVIAILTNQKIFNFNNLNSDVIIITEELTPSMTFNLNTKFVKGIITKKGGITSHSAIIARSLNIPAISNIDVQLINDDELVILDSNLNQIIVNPSELKIKEYKLKSEVIVKTNKLISDKELPIEIKININNLNELNNIDFSFNEEIGLFRTEYLFYNNQTLPTEEEQIESYKKALEFRKNSIITFRLFDIGNDKIPTYIKNFNEPNPALGLRGVRYLLNNKEILKTQLRALLRASSYGKLKIMIPLVSTIEEVIEVRTIFNEIKTDFKINNIKFDNNVELGIMIEVPSIVYQIDSLNSYVDFYSIGSNDLLQYFFASDRLNENTTYLYQPLNPGFLNFLFYIIKKCKENNKKVGVCGEIANNELITLLLVGMGLDNISINNRSVNTIKGKLVIYELEELKILLNKVLLCKTESEVKNILEKYS